MIIQVSIPTPEPGKEQDLIASTHRYGAAVAEVEGFVLEEV